MNDTTYLQVTIRNELFKSGFNLENIEIMEDLRTQCYIYFLTVNRKGSKKSFRYVIPKKSKIEDIIDFMFKRVKKEFNL